MSFLGNVGVDQVLQFTHDDGLPRRMQLRRQVKILEALLEQHQSKPPDQVNEAIIEEIHREISLRLEDLDDAYSPLEEISQPLKQYSPNKKKSSCTHSLDKRDQKKRTLSINESLAQTRQLRICHTCKSDLEPKLLVKCRNCPLAIHTYCLNPPISGLPPSVWVCADCHSGVDIQHDQLKVALNESYSSIRTWSPPKLRASARGSRSPSARNISSTCETIPHTNSLEDQTTQDLKTTTSNLPYQWREFCDKKLTAVKKGNGEELVYYQHKQVLARKVSEAWIRFVSSRKTRKRRRPLLIGEKIIPENRNVTYLPTTEELEKMKERLRTTSFKLIDHELTQKIKQDDSERENFAQEAQSLPLLPTIQPVMETSLDTHNSLHLVENVLPLEFSSTSLVEDFKGLFLKTIAEADATDPCEDLTLESIPAENYAVQPCSVEPQSVLLPSTDSALKPKTPSEEKTTLVTNNVATFSSKVWSEDICKFVGEQVKPTAPLHFTNDWGGGQPVLHQSLTAAALQERMRLAKDHAVAKEMSLKKRKNAILNQFTTEAAKEDQKLEAILQSKNEKEDRAARKIQRFCRRGLAHRLFLREKSLQEHAAATVINMAVRRYLISGRKAAKAEAAVKVQSMLRGRQARKAAKEVRQQKRRRDEASRVIFNFFTRKVSRYLALKHELAIRIQRRWRIVWAKKELQRRRTQRILEEQDKAATTIQSLFRKKHAQIYVHDLRRAKAATLLQRYARGRIARKKVKLEKYRMQVIEAALAINIVEVDVKASAGSVLLALGMHYYSYGDFWYASSFMERAYRDMPDMPSTSIAALAYSHHNVWYSTYEKYNLDQAFRLYQECMKDKKLRHDPYILYDLAVVQMHQGDYPGSLELFTHVLTYFPRFSDRSKALFMIILLLQKLGQFEKSQEYLQPFVNEPPFSYTQIDMFLLLSFCYENTAKKSLAKDAIKLSFHQWKQTISKELSRVVTEADMFYDLARRSATEGHYLLSAAAYIRGIKRAKVSDSFVWMELADVMRHIGGTSEMNQAIESALALDPTNEYARSAALEWTKPIRQYQNSLLKISDVELIYQLVPTSNDVISTKVTASATFQSKRRATDAWSTNE